MRAAANGSEARHRRRLSIEEYFQRIAHELGLVVETPDSPWGSACALLSAEEADGRSRYRYAYALWWDRNDEPTLSDSVAWVLLNPLGLDSREKRRRRTLGYCRKRTAEWSHGGLVIVNLFAHRANDPDALWSLTRSQAVGPVNNHILEAVSQVCPITVAAWGNDGRTWNRSRGVRPWLANPQCVLGRTGKPTTNLGEPFHPRTLPRAATLSPLP